MAEPKTVREVAIKVAVVEAFLETGKALDANEIAARLDWSVSKVRQVIKAAHGCVDGLTPHQESRESNSKSYPGFTAGAHKVWVYQPSLETLRAMINDLRGAR
jgi:hypothetical protein